MAARTIHRTPVQSPYQSVGDFAGASKKLKGPDHSSSLSPNELINYVKKIRSFSNSIGKYQKKPYREEMINSKVIKKQIVALKKIQKGEKLSLRNLGLKRPAHGLHPNHLQKILGKI